MKSTPLSNEAIESASEEMQAFLETTALDQRDRIRFWISMENVLLHYQETFGTEATFSLQCGKRWGKQQVVLTVKGVSSNPFEGEEDDLGLTLHNMLASVGLAPTWFYGHGRNTITLTLAKPKHSPVIDLIIAAGAAVVCGILCTLLPDSAQSFLSNTLFPPLSETFTGMLSAISGPMVFLSVVVGIVGIGDTTSLGLIGKRMMLRFLLFTVLGFLLCSVILLPFFPLSLHGSTAMDGSASALYTMILDMIPHNILTPFVEANPMQIITLAIIVGISVLILGKTTSAFSVLMEQANLIVRLIIGWIGALVPAFIFITLFQMILSNQFSTVLQSYKWVISMAVAGTLVMLAYSLLVCFKTKVSLPVFVKKLLPTFLITITTSSSAAAFSTNVDTCENRLGIDNKIVHFGIPLGQVVFMLGGTVLFFTAALCMSDTYGIAITPLWICVTGIVVVVLSIAAPPIPGGPLTCYTILFTQIGLPMEAIAIALVVNMVLEFFGTAINIYCLQCELVLLADSLDMLDRETLRRAD